MNIIDLRVSKKSKDKFVILDFNQNRKQITCKGGFKKWTSKSAAEVALKALIADVATKKVIITNRYKFKEEYLKFASKLLGDANKPGTKLTKASIRTYKSNYDNYISDCFPDIYVDEVSGPVLEQFVLKIYNTKQNSFNGRSIWIKVKDVVYKIKTFLRYAASRDMDINEKAFHWHLKNQYHLQPEDHELFYPKITNIIQPAQTARLINGLYANRHDSYNALLKLAIITSFTFLGLRNSELKGIKKADVNFAKKTIWIGGMWSTAENRFVKRTKKRASTRHVEILDGYLPYITEWMDKIKDIDNPYLFPSLKTKTPISNHHFRTILWTTLEEYGLATLKWKIVNNNNLNGKRNTGKRGITKSFTVINSPFMGCPTRTFRHGYATPLVNAVKATGSLIDQNYVMNALGHGDYKTTENIYGNHVLEISSEERAARRVAVQKAMNLNLITSPNNQKLIKR